MARRSSPRRPHRAGSLRKTAHAPWQDQMKQNMHDYAGALVFYLLLLLIVIFSWIPLPQLAIAPYWVIVVAYIWSARWSHMMPAALLFIIGLLSDIVIGTPLGIHAFGLLLVMVMTRLQQRFLATQGFFVVWANFAVMALLFNLLVTGASLMVARASPAAFDAVMNTFGLSLIAWALLTVLFPIYWTISQGFMTMIAKWQD